MKLPPVGNDDQDTAMIANPVAQAVQVRLSQLGPVRIESDDKIVPPEIVLQGLLLGRVNGRVGRGKSLQLFLVIDEADSLRLLPVDPQFSPPPSPLPNE